MKCASEMCAIDATHDATYRLTYVCDMMLNVVFACDDANRVTRDDDDCNVLREDPLCNFSFTELGPYACTSVATLRTCDSSNVDRVVCNEHAFMLAQTSMLEYEKFQF